ncbi:MAG: hypothetical protein IIY04_06670 [Oscillospiraceae bacterium]|nr:hypothetical protein [Oscillospiraceae bacterium]
MAQMIAKAAPFSGAPKIHMPSVFGVPTGKPLLYYIPVTGQRPMDICVEGLCEGLCFENGVLQGTARKDAQFQLRITARNELGTAEKCVAVTVGDNMQLLTPLLGFTSWNAFAHKVRQEDMEQTAQQMAELGLRELGYGYVNLDSGWQKEYGGEFDAIMPNEKFPDMKAMTDKIHSLGLRAGIYSTPMRTAWGCPEGYEWVPGCTVGEPDPFMPDTMGGIGLIHKEENNVRQWQAWEFDYLKYDWSLPDPVNAEKMRVPLMASKRAFAFCVTVLAHHAFKSYWKQYCNSWRDDEDSIDEWDNIKRRLLTVDKWLGVVNRGHFFDLDMLEIGAMEWNEDKTRLTPEEALFAFTMRAFFLSPIQISCKLDKLSAFEFDMICNDEILAINQDAECDYPQLAWKSEDEAVKIYRRSLENGASAIAVFNTKEEAFAHTYELEEDCLVRDVWAKEDIVSAKKFDFTVPAHGVRVFRFGK